VLAIEVEYLLNRVYAGDFQERGRPEWPPHPARLYSALVSAHFETGPSDATRSALEWLERQPAPGIYASKAEESADVTSFVPTNYPGDGPTVVRGKQPRRFPSVTPHEASAFFIWPDASPPPEVRAALEELTARTGYLGKACSLVRIRLNDDAPKPNYVPSPAGPELMRVSSPGRLQELEYLFESGQRPSFGLQQRYEAVQPSAARTAQSQFGEMLMFRRISGTGLSIEATVTLTQAVRRALLAIAGEAGFVPEALHGHGKDGHCAITALPFTSHEYADGHLVGFSVVLQRTITPSDRIAVLKACSLLQTVHLPAPLAPWAVELIREPPREKTLQQARWTRASRNWSSVTPILLDRFPKKNGPSVEEILATACTNIGLPRPRITHGPYSNLPGVSPVPQFRIQRKGEMQPRWGVHATMQFDELVTGPVSVGAGRFFGLGLMAPIPEVKGETK
jgi:CRISPR-associated protein Csb2